MRAVEFIVERKRRRRRPGYAAYGPGPYGGYGYYAGYSGDSGSDGGGDLGEKINPKTLTRGFVQEKDMGWYTLQAVGDFASRMADEPPTMEIYAMLKPEAGKRDGKQIGQLSLKIAQGIFLKNNPEAEALVAGGVTVDSAYQRKGVASSMYAFAKELGNDVIASVDQSDDAVAMWKGMQAKGGGESIKNEDAMMGKIADSGKIIRILKKQHTVPFSDEKNWLLVDMDPAKGNKGLGIKWIPADTRFEWVMPYRDTAEKDVSEGLEQITEYRDRLLQYVKSLLPTWPEYVLKDWLVPNKGDFSNLPTDAIKNGIMEKVQGAGLTPNSKWQLVSDMKFTIDMFDTKTKQLLAGRAGGTSDLGMGIPRDKERHTTQAALAQQQGGVRKEPVILIKTAKGYELLEGWHRTIQHFVKYPDGYTGPAYVAVAQDVSENFADGRNPQDKGDSKRHGIPTKASLSSLDKIGRGSGRKAQLARWQANMRRGRAK
jgi:GNAT superfamily N-acetyltransferase